MMMTTLQTLIDNGLSNEALVVLLNSIITSNSFKYDSDKRFCIALLHDREQGVNYDPDGYTTDYCNIVKAPNHDYLVLDDDEADVAVAEYIENEVWAFCPSFLNSKTGVHETIFEALADKCEDANDAILSVIKNTCSLEAFIESAIFEHGRGHFLASYDGKERELSVDGYYVYQLN